MVAEIHGNAGYRGLPLAPQARPPAHDLLFSSGSREFPIGGSFCEVSGIFQLIGSRKLCWDWSLSFKGGGGRIARE